MNIKKIIDDFKKYKNSEFVEYNKGVEIDYDGGVRFEDLAFRKDKKGFDNV